MGLDKLDFAIIALYLAGITLFGLRFRKKQRTLRDYFLAGREIPWWAIGLSIVAAETSTLKLERPTGRRGALCTRAPSWTFTSFDPRGSQFMPATKRTADGPALAACGDAATNAVTLRSRFDLLVYEWCCGPSGPPLFAEANGLRGLFWS